LSLIRPYLSDEFGNPSSKTNSLGIRAREAIEKAREQLGCFLGAEPEEVIFTSGGTEANFSALVGVFRAQREKRHLILSAVEHPAVSETAKFLREMCGVEYTQISVDCSGQLNLDQLNRAIRPDTAVLSVMLANNETGVLSPLREIVEFAHTRKLLVHTDAVQAIGKVPLDFHELGVDLLSLSAHKFGGVKGAGALFVRTGTAWEGVVKGGGQESGRRGGTESVPLIAALGEAARIRKQQMSEGLLEHVRSIRDFFEQALVERIPQCRINGTSSPRTPNTSSVLIEDTLAQDVISLLNQQGIILSAGSACKTASPEPSHVLRAMGLTTVDCLSTVRFSFGAEHTRETVLHVLDILCQTVAYLRAESSQQILANSR
jgi:cysteine desulfurase